MGYRNSSACKGHRGERKSRNTQPEDFAHQGFSVCQIQYFMFTPSVLCYLHGNSVLTHLKTDLRHRVCTLVSHGCDPFNQQKARIKCELGI